MQETGAGAQLRKLRGVKSQPFWE